VTNSDLTVSSRLSLMMRSVALPWNPTGKFARGKTHGE